MKKVRFLIVLVVVLILSSCASTNSEDGFLSVGKVSNTECERDTRASTTVDSTIPDPILKLTKQGSDISGELIEYPVLCLHGDLGVSCSQEGPKLHIKVTDAGIEGAEIGTFCACRVNIYFTLYNVEGENFRLFIGDLEYDAGEVSFKEHSIVEINLRTNEVKYEVGGDA